MWLEATTLQEAGFNVSVICPKSKGGNFQASHEVIEDVNIYRYFAPPEANHAIEYFIEFIYCWFMTAILSLRVWRKHRFNIIQACNPPETYFLLAWFYKLFKVKFVFDHHDLSPEMYVAKGGTDGGILYRILLTLERLTFKTADMVLTTNESHKFIAIERGGVPGEKIYVVRSGPDLQRLKILPPEENLKIAKSSRPRILALFLKKA